MSLAVGFLGLFCITAMMLITTIDLMARSVFGRAITGVFEIMSLMFCVTLYSGLAYCQTQHGHIHVTLLVTKLPGRLKYLMWGITSLIGAGAGCMVAAASLIQAGVVEQQYMRTVILWVPYYPFYTFGGICMSLLSLCMLLDCVKSFVAVFNPKYADEVNSMLGE
jgi:TRAP-type C4-dicarboxylate transport system permease small subunit